MGKALRIAPRVGGRAGDLPECGRDFPECWRFTKNVELHLISSAFGLACSGAAPPPAAPPLFFERAIFSPFGRARKKFLVFLAPSAHARK
ncbi:TPA: hypothetical protein DHT69_03545 [Candidatus Collierbacteria bacterium]|nr:hypothetical protein [Candidatus Collierbacteria bacterium]